MTEILKIENTKNDYQITGDSIGELLTTCLMNVREISKVFYARELLADLSATGQSIIDIHAGRGCFYKVKLKIK